MSGTWQKSLIRIYGYSVRARDEGERAAICSNIRSLWFLWVQGCHAIVKILPYFNTNLVRSQTHKDSAIFGLSIVGNSDMQMRKIFRFYRCMFVVSEISHKIYSYRTFSGLFSRVLGEELYSGNYLPDSLQLHPE